MSGHRNLVLILLIALLLLAGCGGNSDSEDVKLTKAGLVDLSALPDPVLTSEDIEATEPGSPQRAYLSYWRDAQFQNWAGAMDSFDPGLVDAVGFDELLGGLRSQAALMRVNAPALESASTSEPGLTSLPYAIVDAEGDVTTQTATLREKGGRWLIVYDSFLDGAIGGFVAGRVQAEIDPSAPTNSIEADRAGGRATLRQGRYLEQLKRGG